MNYIYFGTYTLGKRWISKKESWFAKPTLVYMGLSWPCKTPATLMFFWLGGRDVALQCLGPGQENAGQNQVIPVRITNVYIVFLLNQIYGFIQGVRTNTKQREVVHRMVLPKTLKGNNFPAESSETHSLNFINSFVRNV